MKFRSRLAEGGPGSGIPGHKPGDAVPNHEEVHGKAMSYHMSQAEKADARGDSRAAAAHDDAFNAHAEALKAHRSGAANANDLSKEAHAASADAKSTARG